ncbi:hypothetical protein EVAR_98087_1 [Eumeta japonica]|uniref:Uncharacterized protein n=1 Tax=Eumeta variegata TaxID=151549 RepID=A0A4C1WCX5_EUMVA|nr:hypothetical protein EVAR_98087_1 [Eumeta japonica]
MDEDLNDEELESRTHASIQDVYRTQTNEIDGVKNTEANFTQSTPRSDSKQLDNKDTGKTRNDVLNISNHVRSNSGTIQTKPKEEVSLPDSQLHKPDISAVNVIVMKSEKTINFDNKADVVELQSSDDDDVVEVALPPKPTITIESSDDEELTILTPVSNKKENITATTLNKIGSPNSPKNLGTRPRDINREVSASPVPSVVSSVSDDFIRGDCIAFNISSKKPVQPTFDFSVHESDLVMPIPPVSHKKKKKKNKNKTMASVTNVSVINTQECFITPNNKSKNKKCNKSNTPKTNLSQVVLDTNKTKSVQQKNLSTRNTVSPIASTNANTYHSDNNSTTLEVKKGIQNNQVSIEKDENLPTNNQSSAKILPKENVKDQTNTLGSIPSEVEPEIIDLIEESSDLSVIANNIVMGNVTGFEEDEDYSNFIPLEESDSVKLGSTKVPEILSEQMDFDTERGIFRFKSMRKLTEHSLKVEMEKFYNESWGGEDFNHKEILKHLPRDKNLWRIDPKDRFSTPSKRKVM